MNKYATFTQARVIKGGRIVARNVCLSEALCLHSIASSSGINKAAEVLDFVLEGYAEEISQIINERSFHKR